MRRPRNPQIGLDSQCLSYLLDGIAGIDEPLDPLAPERKALLRCWFYRSGTFTLTETVIAEVERIRNEERREFHKSFLQTLFVDCTVRDIQAVKSRADQFKKMHPKPADCRILAEAEELGLDVLLTYDRDFLKRLHNASPTTKLIMPSVYWNDLGVPIGAEPRTVPHPTNPLSLQPWWRW